MGFKIYKTDPFKAVFIFETKQDLINFNEFMENFPKKYLNFKCSWYPEGLDYELDEIDEKMKSKRC